MDIIEKAVSLYGYQNRHPEMDDLQTYCCCEIIKRFKPNLLLTHPGFVDDERHRYGVFNDKIEASLVRTDAWLAAICEAVKEAGIEDETDFVVLGDHGQINITRTVHINSYLKRAGFIQTDEKGKILSWDAYAYSVGASAHVYLSKKDEELYSAVYSLLSSMANEGVYGFEKVYTINEVKEKYGLYGDFSFVLETDGYTAFGDAIKEPPIASVPIENCRYGRGTHGYEPEKGPQTTLIAIGPSIKKDAVIEKGELINHAPTFAKILGIDFACDGKPETRILK
jgi:predicted AlkP superfamily pyrophosphatase or phosphodiesterase